MSTLRAGVSQAVRDNLRDYFSQNPLWEYEKPLGEGAAAVTILVRERSGAELRQRMAVKRSKDRMRERALREEIEWLKRLRGSEHCGQMLVSGEDGMGPLPPDGAQNPGFLENIRNLRKTAFQGLLGPIVGLEYLENGTLASLLMKIAQRDMPLPNRVLWSFFLCMVRACVALAYPPGRGEYEPTELETVPDGGGASNIYHGDLHLGNIMIGDYGGRFEEHRVVPVVKFIDFGKTTENATAGVVRNLHTISLKLLSLIARDNLFEYDLRPSVYNGIKTKATEILPHDNGAYYPRLDPNLRDFLAICLAEDIKDRPGLKEMLDIVEQNVKSQSQNPEYFTPDIRPFETDDAISGVMQELLHDADTKS